MVEAVEDSAPEVSVEPEVTESTGELPASVNAVLAKTVDGAADGETTEQDNRGDEDMITASEGPVSTTVATDFSDENATVTDQLTPTGVLVSGTAAEDSTLPLSVGSAMPEAETEPEQDVSASDALVAEESAVMPVAGLGEDGEFNVGKVMAVCIESADEESNRTVGELVSDDTAPAEVSLPNPEGDDTDEPSGSTQGTETGETQPLTMVVDEQPKVDQAAAILGDPEASMVSQTVL